MFVSHKRTHNLFNLTNFWKNSVIDNMVDDLPSTQDHHKPPALVDESLEDLLYKQAFEDQFNPWPEPPEQEIEPVTMYEQYM